jgi:hypothetical protein
MIGEAQKNNTELVLVVGRKLPRWPECHEPEWIKKESLEERNKKLLEYIKESIIRYKEYKNVSLWQVENEPFLKFGECPEFKVSFLEQEISLVRSIDPSREIMITDSGELSLWVMAAKRADIFGTTLYRIIWKDPFGHIKYPLPPKFFWIKANLVHFFYPNKPIIVSELQAEPWGPKMPYETPLDFQFKSMNIDQFHDNIEYTKQVGFPEVYLWGAEWWYWLKTKQGHPEFWEEAKKIISG